MSDQGQDVVDYSLVGTYAKLAQQIVEYFVEENEEVPPKVKDIVQMRYRNVKLTAELLDGEIEKFGAKAVLKTWLELGTATKAVVKRFLREWLVTESGNPFSILVGARVAEGDIPKILDLEDASQNKELQSSASISFAVAVIKSFLLFGSTENLEVNDNISVEVYEDCNIILSKGAAFLSAEKSNKVDHSGAAYEELKKQNAMLQQQNRHFQRQLDELQRRLAGMPVATSYADGVKAAAGMDDVAGKITRKPISIRNKGVDVEIDDDSFSVLSEDDVEGYATHEDESQKGFSALGDMSVVVGRSERSELIMTLKEATKIKNSSTATDLTYLNSQIESKDGMLWINARGDIYKIKKASVKDSVHGMFRISLLSANYRSSTSLSYGNRMPQNFLPANFTQFKAHMEEEIVMLEADEKDPMILEAALSKGVNLTSRLSSVTSYSRHMRGLILNQGHLVSGNDVSHERHVQVWALFAQFHYLFFSYAMASNKESLLKEALQTWATYYEGKIRVISLHVGIQEAAAFLGYGCSKCRRGGMLDNYCMYCNKEDVGELLGSRSKRGDVESFDVRYDKWRKEEEAKGVKDPKELSRQKFKKVSPAPLPAKKSSKVITADEYYQYLEGNQQLFRIALPSKMYLNR